MSADNGIYILETPIFYPDGMLSPEKEYRVAHAQAIDNITFNNDFIDTNGICISEYYKALLFGYSEVYKNKADAQKKAFEIEEEILNSDFPILEYGISTIKLTTTFPKYSIEEADQKLQTYWGMR